MWPKGSAGAAELVPGKSERTHVAGRPIDRNTGALTFLCLFYWERFCSRAEQTRAELRSREGDE